MSDTFEFPKRDDNSTVDADKLVKWATAFDGVDAHIVYDSIADGNGNFMHGALNGVTLQWDHDDDGVADGAVHAPAGSVITRLKHGFEVAFTRTREIPVDPSAAGGAPVEMRAVTSEVVRTVDGEIASEVSA